MKMLITYLTLALVVSCTKKEVPVVEQKEALAVTENLKMPRLQIDEADRSCVKDSDCVSITIQCSCHCGEGINKNNVAKYEGKLEEMCKNYNGKMCTVLCDGGIKCKDKLCSYVQK